MDKALLKIMAENAKLLTGVHPVRECVVIPGGTIEKVAEGNLTENATGESRKATRYKIAKVGHADKVNQNLRIYPRKEWEKVINRSNSEAIPQGKLLGAVDHVGMLDGGSLKDTCVMWHSLSIEKDNSVHGEFSIIEAHSRGKDLMALIEAGAAIGFSTYAMAKSHEPDEDEREQYGLDEDSCVVVMQDVSLVAIDAVNNPSVIDAWMQKEGVSAEALAQHRAACEAVGFTFTASEQTEEKPQEDPITMKSLDDLKQAHPEVFALHVAAVEAAKTEAAEAAKVDAQKSVGESVRKVLEDAGVEVSRVLTEADAQARIDAAKAEADAAVAVAEAAKVAAEAAKAEAEKVAAEAQAKLDAAEAEVAESARKEAVIAEGAKLLKGNRFEAQITKVIEKAAENKEFKAENVKALVDGKIAEYEAIAGPVAANAEEADGFDFGISGDASDDGVDASENAGGKSFAESMAAELFHG